MSKITGKKKSCFQITSVTQSESRTEDVSAEIFDVSRVEQGVCDRSSPEETLGDCQEGQILYTGPVNGGLSHESAPTGEVTPHNAGGSVPVSAPAQPFVPTSNTVPAVSTGVAHTAPSSSCSSRFRVIKLDHGTGEPFRRGRWTCTEFYEKDSDSNVNRTVDSIKPTPDHSIDRDSGLGVTSNSVVSSSAFSAQTFENSSDSSYSVSTGHPTRSHASDPLQQGYSLSPQIGSGASAFQPTGFTTTASQQTKQAQVNMHLVTPQTFLPNSLNGVHQGGMQQNSPIVPSATQPQQFAYSHPTGFSSSHIDYHQQHFGSNIQNLPITSPPVGSSTSQVSSPPFTPAGPATQVLVGETVSAQGPGQQVISAPVMCPIPQGNAQQQPVNQTQPSGGLVVAPAPSGTTTSSHSGGQNVPATVPSTTSIPPGVSNQVPSTGGRVQLQGAHGGAIAGLYSSFSNQAEDGRQITDALPHHSAGAVPGADGVKTPVSEGLRLPTPSVNSLFNIQISMDDDEDRNPSAAFYQAFRPSRLRGSKPVNDSASGASVVAIDNKIEQAMDLVKSHLMYAVREEVEVLKEQIKELYERNSVLERENAVLKSLANTEQLSQLSGQHSNLPTPMQLHQYPLVKGSTASLVHHEGSQSVSYQPNITSA